MAGTVRIGNTISRAIAGSAWVIRIPVSGGKAGRGRNKTGTVQVLVDNMLHKQFRFTVGDEVSRIGARDKAIAYVNAAAAQATPRTVCLLFSDDRKTRFMQDAGVFEKSRVLLAPVLEARVVADWGGEHVKAILARADYTLVAAWEGRTIHYCNPNIQTVSDGECWCLLDDYLKIRMSK